MAGVFKKNDIRGVVGEQLTEGFCETLGYIFAKHIGKDQSVAIAGDTRKSTPILKKALIKGLQKGGVNVYDLGVGPTPLTYFVAAHHTHIDEAIMITGSHNPPDQNGIKICDKTGQSYHYENLFGLLEERLNDFDEPLEDMVEIGDLVIANDLKQSYFEYLTSDVSIKNKFSVIVDCGKGATFQFIDVLEQLGLKYKALGTDPDGTFDGLPPDPAKPHTFENLKEEVTTEHIAIAFDTDGDRVGFMTKNGDIISPDIVAMLLAENVKIREPEPHVIIDVKVSKSTKEYIETIGGSVSLSQVGHSYIHENLISERGHLAAELSGHYYFHDRYYGFDDGLYTALRFLEVIDMLIDQDIKLEDKISDLPRYYSTKEYRDHMTYETIDQILEDLTILVNNKQGELVSIDGVRGEFNDGWFLARKSGTEEILSYRVEGNTPEARDRILDQVRSIISKHNELETNE